MGCASTDGAQVEVPADTYSTRIDLQQSMPPRSDYCPFARARAATSKTLRESPSGTTPDRTLLDCPDRS